MLDRFLQFPDFQGFPPTFLEIECISLARQIIDFFETRTEEFEICSGLGDTRKELS